MQPTARPTGQPSRQPTAQPSRQPSRKPTGQPSRQPSGQPTLSPTSFMDYANDAVYKAFNSSSLANSKDAMAVSLDAILNFFGSTTTMLVLVGLLVTLGIAYFLTKGKSDN